MKICLVAQHLLPGGVEWFILRLYREFHSRGHDVELLVFNPEKIEKRILAKFPEATVITPSKSIIALCLFFDKILNRLFKTTFFHFQYSAYWMKRYLKRKQPDVIHSHFLGTDKMIVKANKNQKTRHIVTMHGDYSARIKRKMKRFYPVMENVLKNVDNVVIISEEQKEVIGKKYPFAKQKMVKIYNGYSSSEVITTSTEKGVFTFGLIGRSVPEKGWEIAIKAFSKLHQSNVRLALYGEGAYLDELEKTNLDQRIRFMGLTNEPLNAVASFDVGLFPSYYTNESLPTTVIEYLMLHKPVFTTNVGECEHMIDYEGELAGKIIPFKDDKPCIDTLSEYMNAIIDDTQEYKRMAEIAKLAKTKFDMDKCINKYLKLYKNEALYSQILVQG